MKASVGLKEMIQERVDLLNEWSTHLKMSIEDKEKALEEARSTLVEYNEELIELEDFLGKHSPNEKETNEEKEIEETV